MNRGTFTACLIVAALAVSITFAWLDQSTMRLKFDVPVEWTDGKPLLVRDVGYFEMWRIKDGAAELIEVVIPMDTPRLAVSAEPGCYSLVTVARDGRRSFATPITCLGGETPSLTDQQVRDLLTVMDEQRPCPDDQICLEASAASTAERRI